MRRTFREDARSNDRMQIRDAVKMLRSHTRILDEFYPKTSTGETLTYEWKNNSIAWFSIAVTTAYLDTFIGSINTVYQTQALTN